MHFWEQADGNTWKLSPFPTAVQRSDLFHARRQYDTQSGVILEDVVITMLWRSSKCRDDNRDNPQNFLNTLGSMQRYDVVIDIGACYGDTSLPMALRANEVLAFEPNPHSFEILKANSIANPSLRIIPHNLAVGEAGTVNLWYGGDYCNGGAWGDWKRESAADEKLVNVTSVNLHQFIQAHYPDKLHRIGFIKIDVEGFDAQILSTLKPLLNVLHPVIVVEWFIHYRDVSAPNDCTEGSRFLFHVIDDLGYRAYSEVNPSKAIAGCESKNWVPDLWLEPIKK